MLAEDNIDRKNHKTVKALFLDVLLKMKTTLIFAVVATVIANVLEVGVSLYSMQVYDRVIPNGNTSTLVVLTIGVLVSVALIFFIRLQRAHLINEGVKSADMTLSTIIYQRLLRTRLDQMPQSIGTISSQLRGYEPIRRFYTSSALYVLADAPFALIFLGAIFLIAGPALAIVPAFFFIVAVIIGLYYRYRLHSHTKSANHTSNQKLGLLVEAVESLETIQSNGSAKKQEQKWARVNHQAIYDDAKINKFSEHAQYWAMALQNLSYVVLVAVGAYKASTTTELTMGALIAASILSGRVLNPVGQIPPLIVQWGHATQAMKGLEEVWKLKTYSDGIEKPLTPEVLRGEYNLSGVEFTYSGRPETLSIQSLHIPPGDVDHVRSKVMIVGLNGAGKSTLLKLLTGLYAPQRGSLTIDGLSVQHVSRDVIAHHVGYLPQEVKLLSGTLRYNLTMGKNIPESEVLDACKKTGLIDVVKLHPMGLELPIFEGGQGLSGGQKQLVAITRLLIQKPNVWVLDEPTSNMDDTAEAKVIKALYEAIKPEHTLVLVTHKQMLVSLAKRIVFLRSEGVVADRTVDEMIEMEKKKQSAITPYVMQSVNKKEAA